MLDQIKDRVKYFKHIKDFQALKGKAQWSDQFHLEVYMVKPDGRALDPYLIKSFSIQHKGIETETVNIGGGYVNVISGITPMKLDVVFEESTIKNARDRNLETLVYDFFFKDKGKDVIPSDGTFLLPYDWYFYIQGYALNSKWEKKLLFRSDFLVEGTPTKDFVTDGGSIQELTLSFVPIRSN